MRQAFQFATWSSQLAVVFEARCLPREVSNLQWRAVSAQHLVALSLSMMRPEPEGCVGDERVQRVAVVVDTVPPHFVEWVSR